MHTLPEIKRLLIVTDAAAPQVNGVVRNWQYRPSAGGDGHRSSDADARALQDRRLAELPEIRLSLTTSRTVERIIEEINPDALHVSTEGLLGWHVRKIALRRGWKFTTAYHTRFPEYVHARSIPAAWIYKVFRRFHRALPPRCSHPRRRFATI